MPMDRPWKSRLLRFQLGFVHHTKECFPSLSGSVSIKCKHYVGNNIYTMLHHCWCYIKANVDVYLIKSDSPPLLCSCHSHGVHR